MNKRNNKKGFTITELVIVIVVIAILAAVLIPTFASLIKKANVSADTQVAKNLNTALSMAEAEGNKPETFNDVIYALQEAGYIVANLNPTAEGCYFVWESESNQFLLVDGEKDFEVIYKSKDLEKDTINETWHFAVNDTALAAELRQLGATVVTSMSQSMFEQTFDDLFAAGGEETIILQENITLSGEDKDCIILQSSDAKMDYNLNQQTMTVDYYVENSHAFKIRDGEFNIANGTVIVNTKDGTSDGLYGAVTVGASANGQKPVANIEDMVFQTSVAWGNCIRASDNSTVNVKDTTINATLGGGLYAMSNGVMTVENVKINQTGYYDHNSNCVAAANTGVMTIKSGEFTAENYCVYVYNSGGTINIQGGTYTKTANAHGQLLKADAGEIVITGGTFVVNGTTYNFADMDAADWAVVAPGQTISGVGTATVTITK